MDTQDQLAWHLKLFEELGVAGFRRDAAWAARPAEAAADPGGTVDEHAVAAVPAGTADGTADGTAGGAAAAELLAGVRAEIGDCMRCKLHQAGRHHIVFGVGNPQAELMFVGEAPGHDEDLEGIPFVGRAGQKLTQIIGAMGLSREEVYIANVIKCRPPGNRNPEPDEVDTCEPFLFRQLDAIAPKVVVALGSFAARSLLRSAEPIAPARARARLPRRQAGGDVPPRVPAPEPGLPP